MPLSSGSTTERRWQLTALSQTPARAFREGHKGDIEMIERQGRERECMHPNFLPSSTYMKSGCLPIAQSTI